MQVFEGSDLTFLIPNIFRTLQYDLIIRYEHDPKFSNQWEKVTYEVITLDGPPSGQCVGPGGEGTEVPRNDSSSANGSSNDTQLDLTHAITTGEFSMPPDTKQTTITPSLCLEEGKRYQIKFTFNQYDPATPSPNAIINIDSVSCNCISGFFREI
jgi:hypothetical protein